MGSVEYIYENNTAKAKRYIGSLVINIDNDNINRQSWGFNYLLKDHIGSTHTIVNKQGNTIAEMSFNAWGERRKAATPKFVNLNTVYDDYDIFTLWANERQLRQDIEKTTNRGFTGHEHFDQVGIIHMNGRIYDPAIGRFLQADPIIQDPYNTQSLNRYSYVMNNPLSYTDPTGYARLRKGAWRTILAIAITVYTAGAANQLLFTAGLSPTSLAAAATMKIQAFSLIVGGGSVSGGIASGSLKGAIKGGIIAAVTFGIGHGAEGGFSPFSNGGKMFAHSVVSGISAEIDGGKFGHGFVSAVLSRNIGKGTIFDHNRVGGAAIVTNAILQGTISEVTGGKFANGAMSAAFRVAFNDSLPPHRQRLKNALLTPEASPLPGDFLTGDDKVLNLTMMADGQFYPSELGEDGMPHNFNSTNNLMEANRASGVLEGVHPSTWWYGGKTLNFARLGREIVPGRDPKLFRIAFFGNRTGNKYGKFPHYHRRGINPKNGQTLPGQTVKRHRPWELKETDKSFWDRF